MQRAQRVQRVQRVVATNNINILIGIHVVFIVRRRL
jgi:hypothetical protein